MQLINRILLVAVAGGAGIYWWTQEQARREYERQVGALATTLDRRLANPLSPSDQADAQFMRAMVIMADFRELKLNGQMDADESTFLADALQAAGYNSGGEISVISRNLKDNLSTCVELKIFGDGSGSQSMLTGQAPVIHAGPFKDEALVIMRRLGPELAPELINHPANIVLMPAPSADLVWPYTVSDSMLRSAVDMKGVNILDAASYEGIRERSEEVKDKQKP